MTAVEIKQPGRGADYVPIPIYRRGLGVRPFFYLFVRLCCVALNQVQNKLRDHSLVIPYNSINKSSEQFEVTTKRKVNWERMPKRPPSRNSAVLLTLCRKSSLRKVVVIAENSLHEAVERETCWVGISTWTFVIIIHIKVAAPFLITTFLSTSFAITTHTSSETAISSFSQDLQRRRMNHW